MERRGKENKRGKTETQRREKGERYGKTKEKESQLYLRSRCSDL